MGRLRNRKRKALAVSGFYPEEIDGSGGVKSAAILMPLIMSKLRKAARLNGLAGTAGTAMNART
jgi:hypothetical protein